MQIHRCINAVILCMTLAVFAANIAYGQAAPAKNGAENEAVSNTLTLDVTPFFDEVDTNHDDQITLAEWTAAGLIPQVYSMFDRDKKGYFTKQSMSAMKHPPVIDPDHSGKLTLEKMKAYINSKRENAPPQ